MVEALEVRVEYRRATVLFGRALHDRTVLRASVYHALVVTQVLANAVDRQPSARRDRNREGHCNSEGLSHAHPPALDDVVVPLPLVLDVALVPELVPLLDDPLLEDPLLADPLVAVVMLDELPVVVDPKPVEDDAPPAPQSDGPSQ